MHHLKINITPIQVAESVIIILLYTMVSVTKEVAFCQTFTCPGISPLNRPLTQKDQPRSQSNSCSLKKMLESVPKRAPKKILVFISTLRNSQSWHQLHQLNHQMINFSRGMVFLKFQEQKIPPKS